MYLASPIEDSTRVKNQQYARRVPRLRDVLIHIRCAILWPFLSTDFKAFYNGENISITDYESLPEREVVRTSYTAGYEDSNWWASGDDSGANTFLTTPYFPFLSSCAGYGNHMSFAKLVESHPACTIVSVLWSEFKCARGDQAVQ